MLITFDALTLNSYETMDLDDLHSVGYVIEGEREIAHKSGDIKRVILTDKHRRLQLSYLRLREAECAIASERKYLLKSSLYDIPDDERIAELSAFLDKHDLIPGYGGGWYMHFKNISITVDRADHRGWNDAQFDMPDAYAELQVINNKFKGIKE